MGRTSRWRVMSQVLGSMYNMVLTTSARVKAGVVGQRSEVENGARNGRDKKLGEILFFDGAVDLSQVIAKCVTGVGCSLLEVTGEVQLCPQRAPTLNCFCLLPLPLPNVPGSCK